MPSLPPRVTVGMPVRNGERHLAAAVRSLLQQTYGDFELVVSDNASTDRTYELLSDLASGDARVRVLRRAQPVSAATNFNGLLGSARGDYFMWAAHDDLWDPGFIECLAALLDTHRSAAMAFCSFANVDPTGTAVLREVGPFPEFGSSGRAQRLRAFLMAEEAAGKANLVYGLVRRQDLVFTGGMVDWRGAQWGSDMLTVFRVLSRGPVVWEAEPMFRKRLGTLEVTTHPPGDGAPVPLRQLPEWHGYLLGYLRIIASTPSLRPSERRRLLGAVFAKAASGDRAALRRLASRLRNAP